jgi:deazaflavin-dependent oxidoreductase (nitroreductase family)
MNTELSSASTPGQRSGVTPRATTLPAQGAVNLVIRALLRTPLLCRLIGSRLITIHVVGRKSGVRYAVPVAYSRDGDRLVVGTPFGWGRNLRTGQPVSVRYRGKLRLADVEVVSDEPGVVEDYARMARDNHQFARFNVIELDDSGNPSTADLHAAWAHGARVYRFTLR